MTTSATRISIRTLAALVLALGASAMFHATPSNAAYVGYTATMSGTAWRGYCVPKQWGALCDGKYYNARGYQCWLFTTRGEATAWAEYIRGSTMNGWGYAACQRVDLV